MPVHVLHAVRDRIASGWSQGAPARDSSGAEISITNDKASAWTLCTAFALAGMDGPMNRLPRAIRGVADVTAMESMEEWNDAPARTKQDVIDALDAAIEHVEGVGGG
jgi:hypothetical protein